MWLLPRMNGPPLRMCSPEKSSPATSYAPCSCATASGSDFEMAKNDCGSGLSTETLRNGIPTYLGIQISINGPNATAGRPDFLSI